jgi:hypothetical protein
MLGALPQVSTPTAVELAAADAPQRQEWSAVKCSNYLRDLVELWGFEPQTSCMPCNADPFTTGRHRSPQTPLTSRDVRRSPPEFTTVHRGR